MTEPVLVFADEAGNSGTNFLDDQQRWYVLAGIALESGRVEAARARVDRLRCDVACAELKGRRLLANRRSREHVRELFRIVGEHGVPFFAVLEKRFNLAGRFDQIISDPHANPRMTWPEHLDREARRAAAAAVARLPLETLMRIQAALRDPRGADWPSLIRECALRLRDRREGRLADQIEGAVGASLDDLFGHDATFDAKDMAVNEAAFTTFLQLIDQNAVAAGIRAIRMVHDETTSFEATFTAVHDRLRAKGATSTVILDQEGNRMWPLAAINDLTFVVSHDEPLVQAADVLAATVAWICAMTGPQQYRGEPAVKELAELVTVMSLSASPRVIHFFVSDDDLSGIGGTLAELRRQGGTA